MLLQVRVDMGEPILKGADVPTTLQPTQVRWGAGVGRLGQAWAVCVSYLHRWHARAACRCQNTPAGAPTAAVVAWWQAQGETVVKRALSVDGQEWLMTCVSMGNPHAVTYGTSSNPNLKVRCVCECVYGCLWAGVVRGAEPGAADLVGRPCRLKAALGLCRWLQSPEPALDRAAALPCPRCAAQVDEIDIFRIGPMFEKNAVFPARTNTGARRRQSTSGGGMGGGLLPANCPLPFLPPHWAGTSPGAPVVPSPSQQCTPIAPPTYPTTPLHPPPAPPHRVHAEFVEVLDRGHVRMVVWERGAGRTLACGTGACATVVAGVLEGRTDRTCQVGTRVCRDGVRVFLWWC